MPKLLKLAFSGHSPEEDKAATAISLLMEHTYSKDVSQPGAGLLSMFLGEKYDLKKLSASQCKTVKQVLTNYVKTEDDPSTGSIYMVEYAKVFSFSN